MLENQSNRPKPSWGEIASAIFWNERLAMCAVLVAFTITTAWLVKARTDDRKNSFEMFKMQTGLEPDSKDLRIRIESPGGGFSSWLVVHNYRDLALGIVDEPPPNARAGRRTLPITLSYEEQQNGEREGSYFWTYRLPIPQQDVFKTGPAEDE